MIYPAVRRLLAPVCRAIYRVEVRGEEHVPAYGSVVVAANHPSVLDPFVLSSAIERPLRYLAKAELWRVPFCAPLLDALGGIPVNRDMGDRAALAVALAVLEQGDAVGIFPQGGVRRDTWHRGAARLALASGSPLVPVRILATERGASAGPRRLSAGRDPDRRADPGRAPAAHDRDRGGADGPAADRRRGARQLMSVR